MTKRTVAAVVAVALGLTVSPFTAKDGRHCRRERNRIGNAVASCGYKVRMADVPAAEENDEPEPDPEDEAAWAAALPIAQALLAVLPRAS